MCFSQKYGLCNVISTSIVHECCTLTAENSINLSKKLLAYEIFELIIIYHAEGIGNYLIE